LHALEEEHPSTSSTNSIELKVHEVEDLNNFISNPRPIPTYKGGLPLKIGVETAFEHKWFIKLAENILHIVDL
jgi:hypothetical protein